MKITKGWGLAEEGVPVPVYQQVRHFPSRYTRTRPDGRWAMNSTMEAELAAAIGREEGLGEQLAAMGESERYAKAVNDSLDRIALLIRLRVHAGNPPRSVTLKRAKDGTYTWPAGESYQRRKDPQGLV